MANSTYRFSLASDSVAGMGRILQTPGIQGAPLKGWGVGQIVRRDPATHLQNGFIEHPQK
jgi:hypothetical protein